jgi:hypothetical protein
MVIMTVVQVDQCWSYCKSKSRMVITIVVDQGQTDHDKSKMVMTIVVDQDQRDHKLRILITIVLDQCQRDYKSS